MKKDTFAVWTSMGLALMGYAPRALAACSGRSSCAAPPPRPAPAQSAPARPPMPSTPGVPQVPGMPPGMLPGAGAAQKPATPPEKSDQQIWGEISVPVAVSLSPDKKPAAKLTSDVLSIAYAQRASGPGSEDPSKIDTALQRGLTPTKAGKKLKEYQQQESEYVVYRLRIDWKKEGIPAFEDYFALSGKGINATMLETGIEKHVRYQMKKDHDLSGFSPDISLARQGDPVKPSWKGEAVQEKVKARLKELRAASAKPRESAPEAAKASAPATPK